MEGHGWVHHRKARGKGEEGRGGKGHHVVGRALERQYDGEGGKSHKILVVLVEERQLFGRVFAPKRGVGEGESINGVRPTAALPHTPASTPRTYPMPTA